MASFILKGLVTNDGIDGLQKGNRRQLACDRLMFTYAAALSQAVPAATVYVPGRSAANENQALMKPMKTTHLAEIFSLLIYLL